MKRKRTKTATTLKLACSFSSTWAHSALLLFFLLTICQNSIFGRDVPKAQRHAIIFGTVWGPDDRPLSRMEVKIRRANEKKARWDLYSNGRGEFEIAVPAGNADYIISAVTKGYKLPGGKRLQRSPEVTVHVDNDERVDTGLHLR